jgi:ligand-binding sensor domain-containing protein/signal transduction histidine kinase
VINGASVIMLLAATAAAALPHYYVDRWTTENGLPENTVYALAQTHDGYVWLATGGGLVRYDGVTFTIVDVGEPHAPHAVRIRALHEDHTGALWIATEYGGVSRYADGQFTTYTTKQGLPTDMIFGIAEDDRGRIWLATEYGLVCLDRGHVRTYTTRDGLPFDAITRMASDGAGGLWIGTIRGLARLDFSNDHITVYTADEDGLPNNYVRDVLVRRRDGSVWFATWGGLARLDSPRSGRFTTYTIADGLPTNDIRCLYEDRSGQLWIGTTAGLTRFNEQAPHFATIGKAEGLSDLDIQSILEDREGDLWVGTNTGGLNRLKPRKFTAIGRPEGLPGDNIVPITEDAHGDIWIGMTCGGLVRYRPTDGTFKTFTVEDGLAHRCVWSLLAGRDGSLWIGTWSGGLGRLKDGQFTQYTPQNSGLSIPVVLALHEDRQGTLWVGTTVGLNRLSSNGQFQVYRKQDGLAHDEVRFITEDRHGALWIGTSGGLSRFKDGKFTNYTTEQGLSNNFVREIHETLDGTLWIGTYGGGLNRFKDGRFKPITTRDGLYDNVVSRILEDDRGNFWMSGNTGIFRVSRQELDDFADGKRNAITTVAYGVPDGMPITECHGGGQPAGWKAHDGTLWFPTLRGVVTFNPQRIPVSTIAPPVVIEQVLIDRHEQDLHQEINVPPGAADLEIGYTGLSFSTPERVRFRYRLEGLDDKWIEAGTRRTAYYSHVLPGRYRFMVMAANADGIWNTTVASLPLRIVPPFYRTAWFMTLAIASLAGVVLLTYERRIRHLTRARQAQEEFSRQLIASQERERQRVAGELHDSVGQTLVVIKNRALLSLQTPDDPQRALDQMDEIAEAAADAIDEVREISFNLRPYHLDRLGLTKAIDAMIDKAAATNGVCFRKQLDPIDDLFPKDVEINVYRIVQEGITNILKHAAATEACITMTREPRGVTITIRDNGRGFVVSGGQDHSGCRGFGLIGIAERARQFGCEPIIHSAPGRGTTISITLTVTR